MPQRPLAACSHPGCPERTRGGPCPKHQRETRRRVDRERGSAHRRGYDKRWRKARKDFLQEHPLCELECAREGRLTPATVVDHKIPHRGDDRLFWDRANWQAACKPCHDRKTAREDGRWG